jgi:CubicO group peptidase (beta-lactamase class C family)
MLSFAPLAALTLLAADPTPAIRQAISAQISAGEIPGAVTLLASRDRILHHAAHGPGYRKDSIFWIASMTKPLIGVSILMLEMEGKLSVDDLLSRHLPEFHGSPVTLRHLLTHTSGLPENTPAQLAAATTLADLVAPVATLPLRFPPGSRWQYCQSGINLLGRVIEVTSGLPLPEFLARRFFRPLLMKDTTFYLTPQQLPRLITPIRKSSTGAFEPAPNPILHGKAPTDTARYPAANGGLYSTAADYAHFARMLLRGGELDGRRYLSHAAFAKLIHNETGSLKAGFVPGSAWGLAVGLVTEPQGVTAMLSPGAFGHGGAFGTQAWIDPIQDRVFILMVQRADFPNADDSPVRLAFQQAATAR